MKEKYKQIVEKIAKASTIEELRTINEIIIGDEEYPLITLLQLILFQQVRIQLSEIKERLIKLEQAHKEF